MNEGLKEGRRHALQMMGQRASRQGDQECKDLYMRLCLVCLKRNKVAGVVRKWKWERRSRFWWGIRGKSCRGLRATLKALALALKEMDSHCSHLSKRVI